ncbi:MAG: site-specific integrase [Candidatus Thiodiazotropha taylori]|nr:site-specific integrase [Candidatus Thiodiazotropha taylori]MCG8113290.1 site-specific integrase [Candidatus Thiodiazotropha taylori]MCW4285651.1 site-specific integrase [Candidatus Thiodiazotropha taylori]MCW4327740.1 site-specific integrase [Candidatus Thiodiazotropha taylori]
MNFSTTEKMNALSFEKDSKNQKLLQTLRGTHVSKAGYEFEFESNKWRISGGVSVGLGNLLFVDSDCRLGFRAALSRYAEEYSADHTRNMADIFSFYIKHTQETRLSIKGITLFKEKLGDDLEWRLGSIKAFWLSWVDWGFPGVDKGVGEFLEELVLSGIEKGKAVKKRCPYTGPLTELEQSALLEWSGNAFLEGDLDLHVYTYFIALLLTGRRGVQIRSLRACDLSFSETEGGNNYEIKVPRAKQYGEGFRGSYRLLSITEDLYLLLRNQIDESIDRIEKYFDAKASELLRSQLPIFPAWGRLRERSSIHEVETLLAGNTPDYLHVTRGVTEGYLQDFTRKSQAVSERTGDYIHLSSRRLRYTKGTNLARKGIRGAALAVALDHSDKQHIGVYTENTPENAGIIDEIMAGTLAPLAQAFAGTLIDSERDALRANDPHSRVKNDHSNNVGSCGTHSFCASGYRACYTCIKFQPWRDAPHHEVLEAVLKEREQQKQAGISDNVIKATDRLLLAVKQVIQLCEEAKAQEGVANV